MLIAYLSLVQCIKEASLQPKMHIMDNNVSIVLSETIKHECKLELLLSIYLLNVTEGILLKWQNFQGTLHYNIGRVSKAISKAVVVPIADTCREMTLSILQPSHASPAISAHYYLFGRFHFNCTPMAPIGREEQWHVKSGNRGTYEEYSANGWFFDCSKSKSHYCTFLCYIRSTKGGRRVCDTVQLMHKYTA